MELDEMKLLLKQRLEEGNPLHSAADLEMAVRKKTGSLLGNIKKNMLFEFVAFLLCSIIALACWMTYATLFVHLFCIAAWIFCTAFSVYLYTLYRRIIYYETAPVTIKERLQQIIGILNRFTKLYFQISMGLLPVIFVFGLITGYMDVSKQGLLEQFHWSKGMLAYSIAFVVCWPAVIWFFSKWYIKKLYSDYLLQLQHQLKEIENG